METESLFTRGLVDAMIGSTSVSKSDLPADTTSGTNPPVVQMDHSGKPDLDQILRRNIQRMQLEGRSETYINSYIRGWNGYKKRP